MIKEEVIQKINGVQQQMEGMQREVHHDTRHFRRDSPSVHGRDLFYVFIPREHWQIPATPCGCYHFL